MINAKSLALCKPGVTILNVSRGGLIDTNAMVSALQTGAVGAYGADVYEHEAAYFFDDHSAQPEAERDQLLASLLAQPNAQITGHQAFLTTDALSQIVGTTMLNLGQALGGGELKNEVKA